MRSISGRYLWERSVSIPWRSITHGSTDRKKVLQNATLRTVRSMRSVLLGTMYFLSQLPYRPRVPKAALNVIVAKGESP